MMSIWSLWTRSRPIWSTPDRNRKEERERPKRRATVIKWPKVRKSWTFSWPKLLWIVLLMLEIPWEKSGGIEEGELYNESWGWQFRVDWVTSLFLRWRKKFLQRPSHHMCQLANTDKYLLLHISSQILKYQILIFFKKNYSHPMLNAGNRYTTHLQKKNVLEVNLSQPGSGRKLWPDLHIKEN